MFNSPITSIFRIFNEINDFKEIQNRLQDGGYFNVKDVIVTSLSLLMTSYLLSGITILSDMLLVRLCGNTSNNKSYK